MNGILKRKYGDYSGGVINFDLIGKKKFLRASVRLNTGECRVIDRHIKSSKRKRGLPCDNFRYCKLSISDYKEFNIRDLGVKGIFDKLESIWEQEENNE
jgi:hypothetical protein